MNRIHGGLAGLLVLGSVLTFAGVARAAVGYGAIGVEGVEGGAVIKAGQKVVVHANCKGFHFTGSAVHSPVLDSEDLTVYKDFPEGPFFANAKVREGTKPGTYPISFTCSDTTISGHVVVVGDPQVPVVKKPVKQVAKVPVGAPQTGGGDGQNY